MVKEVEVEAVGGGEAVTFPGEEVIGKEISGKINNKSTRYMCVTQLEMNKPIVRKDAMKEPPFA